MKAMIVGLPQSGKSTLFNAVTGRPADPFAPPEVRPAMVSVPDDRLQTLAKICNPKKVVQATIEFVDVPGCAPDDSHGRDAWRRLLPTVRQADVLVVVARDFADDAVPSYKNRVDAAADFSLFWEELIFADLDAVTTRIERLEAALKKPTKTHELERRELELLTRCGATLEGEKPLSEVVTTEEDRRLVSSFAFLTQKPVICLRNVSDDSLRSSEPLVIAHARNSLVLSASLEAEIAALDPEDRAAFLADYGLESPARDRLIRSCYQACGLISFLTMGPDEVRAWTIREGSTAVEAAGKIHTDIARGFIRAETVSYDDLTAHDDLKGARSAGKVRAEGRAYVVADGDILNILTSA